MVRPRGLPLGALTGALSIVIGVVVIGCRGGLETIQNIINVEDAGRAGDSDVQSSIDASREDGGVSFTTQSVDGSLYIVARGFVLDAPLQLRAERKSEFVGRLRAIAFPDASSSFAQGMYVGLNVPPEIAFTDMASDGLEVVGRGGPDENMSQITFSDPNSDYGDFLYICSNSPGPGDGLFRMNRAGVVDQWGGAFNTCNGPFFDRQKLLGDPGYASPFYAVEQTDVRRYAPNVSFRELTEIEGRISFATASVGAFSGKLWMAESLSTSEMVRVADPGTSPAEVIESREDWLREFIAFPYHHALAFGEDGPLGDYLFLTTHSEVRGYDIDGEHVTVVAGIDESRAIAVQPDKSALWILESGRGQILRLRAE